MATSKLTKLRLPKGKVLLFTPTGKARPMSNQEIADELLLRANFPPQHFEGMYRDVMLASLRGEDLRRFM